MNALPFTLTQLQWALLIFGLLVVLVVVLMSLRDKGGVKTDARGSRVITQPRVEEPSTYGIAGDFDEFGVSKPRRRGDARPPPKMPQLNIEPGPARSNVSVERRQPAYMTQPPAPAPTRRIAPTVLPATPAAPAAPHVTERQTVAAPAAEPSSLTLAHSPGPASTPPAPRKAEEKIFTLLVARRDGVAMKGEKIHKALAAERLSFGPMQIYHRKHEGKRVFSIASLMKPGYLIPEEADGFTTMALSVFMLLPGPLDPAVSFEDMLHTAQRLAEHLDAEVYDGRRQILTTQHMQALRNEVKAWAAAASATS